MRVWFVTVALLFLLVQLYQWLRGFMLPLPVYAMAGAFLAIASNYEKGMASFFPTATLNQDDNIIHQTASLVDESDTLVEVTETHEIDKS